MHKRHLLASTALAILASSATAQAGDIYLSVMGGADWFDEDQFARTGGTTVNFDYTGDGFVLGGAIGTHLDNWVHGLRVELEASYRRTHFDGQWVSTGLSTGGIDGHVSNFALMVNAWYDIDIGQKFVPYVGGGAGWSRQHVEVALLTSAGSLRSEGTDQFENSGFVWQLGAGMNYEVAPGVDVGIGYRYSVNPRIGQFKDGGEFGGEGFGGEGTYTRDSADHTVAVNLTIDID
jgi:opacity protein-like surface antigen